MKCRGRIDFRDPEQGGWLVGHVRLFLNGAELTDIQVVDFETGLIRRLLRDEKGRYYALPTGLAFEETTVDRRGLRLELKPEAPAGVRAKLARWGT